MTLTRRAFLKRGGLALVSVGTMPLWGPPFLQQLVFAADPTRAGGKKILICIFQRGAVDGLSMLVPFGDPNYYQARSDIAIAQPSQKSGPQGVLDLNGFFGLHPNMAALMPIYKSGHLDLLHGNGKDAFDAIGMLKAADPTKYSPRNGASYPNGAFGRSLMQIAQMIKANIGVEVAFAEIGGWDTHVNQGGAQGQLANRFT